MAYSLFLFCHILTALNSYLVAYFCLYCYFSAGQRLDHIMQWLGQWWRAFIIGWLVRYRGEIHVVRYEELLVNTTETMRRVLHFLGTPVTSAQLSCMMKLKEGPVHRHNHSHPSLGIYEKRYNSLYAQIPLLIKRRKYHGLSTSFWPCSYKCFRPELTIRMKTNKWWHN